MSHALDVRIGTLAPGNANTANYIRQIKPLGFESFSLTFWQTLGEVDLESLAREVAEAIGDADIVISALGIFGNPLETTPTDLETLRGWEALIDHAHLFGADIVAGFTGRLRGQPIEASIPRFQEIFGELAQRAADQGVRLAFENCAMDGTWQSGCDAPSPAHGHTAAPFHPAVEWPAQNSPLPWLYPG